MIFKSKIFRRFLTAYLPVTLAPLIIISFIALWYGRVQIRDQTFRQLQIMADYAEAQVLDYLNYLKIQTSGYSKSMLIIDALKKRYRHTGNNNSDRVLNRYLAAGIKDFPECVEMFVLDVNGGVIASSDTSNTGKDLSETDYFLNGQKTVYVSDIFREEETGRITWLVSCPVMDNKVNRLLAVFVSRINPVTLSDITTERRIRALGAKSQSLRIGETGETYMVNSGNLMITESRFLEDVIFKQSVDTEIVRRTRKVSETKAGNYPDYRGIPVDGASMIIWETGWIIISEMDYKESMIPFQRLLNLSLTGVGVLIPLIFFASWLLSRRLTVPIMRLVQADRAIIQGDPSRAFISDHEIQDDELGEVMHTRNIMLTSLKENEKTLKESEERFRVLTETASDAIIGMEAPGIVNFWNKKAEEMFGYPASEAMGKDMHSLIVPEKYHEKALQGLGLFFETGTGTIVGKTLDLFALRRGDAEFPVELSISAMKMRGKWQAVGIIRDITERKQAEEKLKQRLDDLEQFRKVTIQREIRMRELKDRVEELEREIEKYQDTGGKPQ